MRSNPYVSKSQHRLFRALEARSELPKSTASRWMRETPHYERLPEYVSGFGGCFCGLGAEQASKEAPKETFWQRHGAEILVGTITAATGALAVYFAMRFVEKRR